MTSYCGVMLWLVGGTSESRTIARAISAEGCSWVATVTTKPAVRLYAGLAGQVVVGRLDLQAVTEFLAMHKVTAIIDASHPFATGVSTLAIGTGLPYLRFERPETPLEADTVLLPDFDAVLKPEYLAGRCVLLTVGIKALPRFVAWQERATLWARVLPATVAEAIAAGFWGNQIMAEHPPIAADCERALWKKLQIQTVITKASGEAGGVAVKQAVARELGVQLLVIARPKIAYPQQTAALDDVLTFCRSLG